MEALFPSSFSDQPMALEGHIGKLGNEALNAIREKGYSIAVGVNEHYAACIGSMSCQPHIKEYCPNDQTESRFSTVVSTENWLKKGGGRAVFLLLKGSISNQADLAGYGWTGLAPCEQLPNHPVTSAYRIGELALGKGLAKPFIQAIVSGTNALYAKGIGIGLETWQSNPAAQIYPNVGFELVATSPTEEYRPTLDTSTRDGTVLDRRLYMGYMRNLD